MNRRRSPQDSLSSCGGRLLPNRSVMHLMKVDSSMQHAPIEKLNENLQRLAEFLQVVGNQTVPSSESMGSVLAEPLRADRDSPAISVSAMDGYAMRLADIEMGRIVVQSTSPAGTEPLILEHGKTIRVFTGAPVPIGADCVIKREETDESGGFVTVRDKREPNSVGQNVRVRGQNARAGQIIVNAGEFLSSMAMASVASFAGTNLSVYRKLRIGVINTGDELIPLGQPVQPWQIRDSNGPVLEAMLRQRPWLEFRFRRQVGDRFESIRESLLSGLNEADAILLTGGVSMGDCDFVPQAIESIGGKIAFHRLPIRPGRPILGAATADGKLVMGLPGNPVSVAVTAHRFAMPLLRRLAGMAQMYDSAPLVTLAESDNRTLDLVWYRLVKIDQYGLARLVDSQGSGDIVALSISDGFIEIPPNCYGPGPWPFRSWN